MSQTTPKQARLNSLHDDMRSTLANIHPEVAEAMRAEAVVAISLMLLEMRKWSMPKSSRHPVYKAGSIFEALGMDYDAMVDAVKDHIADFEGLLT